MDKVKDGSICFPGGKNTFCYWHLYPSLSPKNSRRWTWRSSLFILTTLWERFGWEDSVAMWTQVNPQLKSNPAAKKGEKGKIHAHPVNCPLHLMTALEGDLVNYVSKEPISEVAAIGFWNLERAASGNGSPEVYGTHASFKLPFLKGLR